MFAKKTAAVNTEKTFAGVRSIKLTDVGGCSVGRESLAVFLAVRAVEGERHALNLALVCSRGGAGEDSEGGDDGSKDGGTHLDGNDVLKVD